MRLDPWAMRSRARNPGILRICEKTSAMVNGVYQDPRRRRGKECTGARGSGTQTVPWPLLVACRPPASSRGAQTEQERIRVSDVPVKERTQDQSHGNSMAMAGKDILAGTA